MLCWDYTWIPCIHAQTQVHTFLRFHTQTCTYHKDESAKTLCQGLTKQQVADLEEAGQFTQILLLSAHVFLSQVDDFEKWHRNAHTACRVSWVPVKLRRALNTYIDLGWDRGKPELVPTLCTTPHCVSWFTVLHLFSYRGTFSSTFMHIYTNGHKHSSLL